MARFTEFPRSRSIVKWLPVVLVFSAINFGLAPAIYSARFEHWGALDWGALVGAVPAQGALLAAYLVWGLGPFPVRLLVHWIVALWLWAAWMAGFALTQHWSGDGESHLGITLVLIRLPLISLALQLPLWLTRCLGWRLESRTVDSPKKPWSIADLLAGMTVVAASLAAALAGRDLSPSPLGILIRCIAIGLPVGVAFALPCCWLMLRIRDHWASLLATGVYGCLLIAASTALLLFLNAGANAGPWPLVVAGVFELSAVATLAGCLLIVRRSGWRLRNDREVASTRSASAEPPVA